MKVFYEDQFCTVYHGDNRDIFPQLKWPFKLLLTDPPYGINVAARGTVGTGTKRAPARKFEKSDWDKQPSEQWVIDMIRSRSKWQVIFGGNYYVLPPQACWLVWDKLVNGDFADCELAWTNLPRAVRKFEYMWNGMLQQDMKNKEVREHECQKPVPLVGWILDFVAGIDPFEENSVVIDPFMGSGSVLRACKDRGIKSVGIEAELRHCETAVRKLSQENLFKTETEKKGTYVGSEQVGLL